MSANALKILVLFDVPYAPPNHLSPREFMVGDDWRDERDVIRTLRRLGHQVSAFGVFDDVRPLIERIQADRPDVIFNQCETFRADRALEPNLTALLELLGVPYTGAGPEALALCKDKGLSKKILSFHKIPVPEFVVSARSRPSKRLPETLRYPVIVKPVGLDASEGITRASVVDTMAAALERASVIHHQYGCDAIIEEYIDGRELYMGVFGNERLTVLPPQELILKKLPGNTPRMLTYKAKWDRAYRKKYGIDSDSPRSPLPADLQARITDLCKQIYRLCKITGYARIDFRLSRDGEPFFIEANPNPSIKKDDDFAWAAHRAGIGYDELLDKIVHLALVA